MPVASLSRSVAAPAGRSDERVMRALVLPGSSGPPGHGDGAATDVCAPRPQRLEAARFRLTASRPGGSPDQWEEHEDAQCEGHGRVVPHPLGWASAGSCTAGSRAGGP
jgi:hypothetical protein